MLGPGNTVGVRLPNHYIAIEVIEKAGGAVACTSANRSGEAPALHAQEVAERIGPDLDLILDGGRAPGGVASTVVAIDGLTLRFIREGAISMAGRYPHLGRGRLERMTLGTLARTMGADGKG